MSSISPQDLALDRIDLFCISTILSGVIFKTTFSIGSSIPISYMMLRMTTRCLKWNNFKISYWMYGSSVSACGYNLQGSKCDPTDNETTESNA
jgi:hypothetical protein